MNGNYDKATTALGGGAAAVPVVEWLLGLVGVPVPHGVAVVLSGIFVALWGFLTNKSKGGM